MLKSALFNTDNTHRFHLYRCWDILGSSMLIIGLNPSTADGYKDDNTSHRCIDFAKREGHGRLWMANLFSVIETDSKKMWLIEKKNTEESNSYLFNKILCADVVVVAWGNVEKGSIERQKEVLRMIESAKKIPMCFGKNGNGSPKHPLYLAKNTPLIEYKAEK